MPLARCSGCGNEGSLRVITSHHRSCDDYALLFRQDSVLAMADPLEVYRTAHPAATAAVPRPSPRSKSAASGAAEGISTPRNSGDVVVEYWVWAPTLLESLNADSVLA